MQRGFFLLVTGIMIFTASCTPKYRQYLPAYYSIQYSKPDYSNPDFWAAHPDKHDPSDSIPSSLRSNHRADTGVDVFFIHPTTFTGRKEPSWNGSLTDASLNAKTDYTTILYQASVFNEYRVFAPRYRQAHLRAYYSKAPEATAAFDTAYEDVRKAFALYIKDFNNNRPFILASHSQGTTHAMRLIRELIDGTPLASKMITAYLIGMYLPQNYFPSLKACDDSTSLHCVCAWRSFQAGYTPSYVYKEEVTSIVVNPLSWNTQPDQISKSANKGSVLRNFNKVYNAVASAKIDHGILWINKPVFPGSIFLRMKNYHVADINFFYVNIRENLRQRVAAYRKKTNPS